MTLSVKELLQTLRPLPLGGKCLDFLFVLQVVMSPHSAPQAFVDNYIKLLPEVDCTEFQKVLEMKVSEGRGMTTC